MSDTNELRNCDADLKSVIWPKTPQVRIEILLLSSFLTRLLETDAFGTVHNSALLLTV